MNRIAIICLSSMLSACTKERSDDISLRELANIQAVRDHMDAFYKADTVGFKSLLAEDVVVTMYMVGREFVGRAEVEASFRQYVDAFRNSEYAIEGEFARGDLVCIQYRTRGVNTGSFMGMPPTNKAVEVHGCVVSRIVDGKIKNQWLYWDMVGLLRQMGLMPEIPFANAKPK
jgi:steroid delta-isomerase-like uncharacterized protein